MSTESRQESTTAWGLEPKTPRGQRMKAKLLEAARTVFARDGFTQARIADIVDAAGAANGSFYRYFTNKHDVLLALLQRLLDDFYELSRSPWQPGDPQQSMFITTKRYFELYRDRSDLMALLIEVAQTDNDVKELWNQSRSRFLSRIEGALARGQRDGVVREPLDCKLAASLLGGMTEQFAYMSFVLGVEPERDLDSVTEAIVDLWARGVLLEPPSP